MGGGGGRLTLTDRNRFFGMTIFIDIGRFPSRSAEWGDHELLAFFRIWLLTLHSLVKDEFEKKLVSIAQICFNVRILLSRMRICAGNNNIQWRARSSTVFPAHAKRIHFYEKELSETSGERYSYLYKQRRMRILGFFIVFSYSNIGFKKIPSTVFS